MICLEFLGTLSDWRISLRSTLAENKTLGNLWAMETQISLLSNGFWRLAVSSFLFAPKETFNLIWLLTNLTKFTYNILTRRYQLWSHIVRKLVAWHPEVYPSRLLRLSSIASLHSWLFVPIDLLMSIFVISNSYLWDDPMEMIVSRAVCLLDIILHIEINVPK